MCGVCLYNESSVGAWTDRSPGEEVTPMGTVGIRELQRNASKIIEQVEETGQPVLVTRHGRAAVALIAINQDDLEDFILSRAPEFAESMRRADEDLRAARTRAADDVFAELLDE